MRKARFTSCRAGSPNEMFDRPEVMCASGYCARIARIVSRATEALVMSVEMVITSGSTYTPESGIPASRVASISRPITASRPSRPLGMPSASRASAMTGQACSAASGSTDSSRQVSPLIEFSSGVRAASSIAALSASGFALSRHSGTSVTA